MQVSSATAASIAAAILTIRAIFAAGLRSRVAPISSANIISAASIASAARTAAVFTARRWGSSARGGRAGRSLRPVASIDNPNPTEGGRRANLGRGRTTPRPGRRNRNHLRLERNHPTANCPIGHASGSGANLVHSHRAPARPAVAHQVRSRRAWTITGSPVPIPPWLGQGQTPGSRSAFPSPWQKINAQ